MATVYGKTSGGDTAIYNSPGTMYWQCYVSYTSTSATLYLYVGSPTSGHLYVNIDSYIGGTDFANYTNTYMASGDTYALGTVSINSGESYSFSATCKSGTWGQNGTLSGTIPRQAYAPSYNSISSSSVTSNSVVLTASVNANGASITAGGWQLSTNGGSTWTPYAGDYASKTITGLTRATTYTYRGYATNNVGTTYSGISTFTTLAAAPSYTATSSSSVTATSVTLSATIDNGGATITTGGWQLSTDGGSTWTTYSGNWTSKSITGLTRNTTYTYRGYATNSAGTSYSGNNTFTTLKQIPTISTPVVSSITSNSAYISYTVTDAGGGTVSSNVIKVYDVNADVLVATINSNAGTATGLSPNTLYAADGQATNEAGTSMIKSATFTTLAPASNVKVSLNGAAFVTGTVKLSQNGGAFVTIPGSKVKTSINGGSF